jgi:alpha-galactosidase
VGGVVGTQFVLPNLVTKHGKSDLTPQRQKIFEKVAADLQRENDIAR